MIGYQEIFARRIVPNSRELFFSFVLLRIVEKCIKFAPSKHRNRHGEDFQNRWRPTKSKTMKKTNSSTQNMTTTQKTAERRQAKEAKARRKVNEDWQRIESSSKYRKAAVKSAGWNTTDRIANEFLDGTILTLNTRNDEKSASVQKRLLRRIVEKRQAQAVHDKTRKSRDRKTAIAIMINTSKCLERLHNIRFAC